MIKMKKKPLIEFEDKIAPLILDLFDIEVDEETNELIDKKFKEPINDPYTQKPILLKDFGGILPVGSHIFISKNNASMAEYITEFFK